MSAQRKGFTFFGMVGGVMALLKLKDRWDDYRQVSGNEDEPGRVALRSPPAYRDDRDAVVFDVEEGGEGTGLLNTELPNTRPVRQKRKGCCVCCGLDCGLFWKAFGIVAALFAIYSAFKLVRWAVAPSPTGLELMPVYSTSLGCSSAPYIYNSSKVTLSVPMGMTSDHAMDIRGGAVGTFIVSQGAADATDIKYDVTIRTDDQNLLNTVTMRYDLPEEGNDRVAISRLVIGTPFIEAGATSCIRFDITMYIPPALKKLAIASHATTQLEFDPKSHINMDSLFVTLYTLNKKNMILPHENLHAKRLTLEVYRGWIVGDVAIIDNTAITTQRGDGISNIRVHPEPNTEVDEPEPAIFRTTTGAGRSDFFYINHKGYPHRPIRSTHLSSGNADMYLTYREAQYNGFVNLDAGSYVAKGLHRSPADIDAGKEVGEDGSKISRNQWAGNKDGGDELSVKSRGWVGLYF